MKELIFISSLIVSSFLFGQELQSTARELKTEKELVSTQVNNESSEGMNSRTPKEKRSNRTLIENEGLIENTNPKSTSKKIKP